jgi:hypothetical protein
LKVTFPWWYKIPSTMTATWAKLPPTTAPTTTLVFVLVFVVVGGGDVAVKFAFPGSYLACKTPHLIYHLIKYPYQEIQLLHWNKNFLLFTKKILIIFHIANNLYLIIQTLI